MHRTSDRREQGTRRSFAEQCAKHGEPLTRLTRYSIENYFSLKALRAVFGKQVPDDMEALDPDRSVTDQLGFSPKRQNRAVVKNMTFDDIRETDLGCSFLKLQEEPRGLQRRTSGIQPTRDESA